MHDQANTGGQVSRGERAAAGRLGATAKMDRGIQIETWNVNTQWQPSKIDNLKKEESKLNLDFVGLLEVSCTRVGQEEDENQKFFYSISRVGIPIRKELKNAVETWWPL